MAIEDDIQQKHFHSPHHRVLVNVMFTDGWLMNEQHSRIFKPLGLTMPQFNVLRILRGQHPQTVRVNTIIERMLDKTSNASRIVDKLVEKKLANRITCPNDRRAVNVSITEAGFKMLEKIELPSHQFEALLTQRLSSEEASTLSLLLDKLRGSH